MDKKISFEEALKQLEAIVKELEGGNLPLEEMVSKFNKGMELSEQCNSMLKDARDITIKLMKDKEETDFEIE